MTTRSICPCGSNEGHEACCGPIINGTRVAATALQLMRSRYSAYARGELEHLLRTIPPDRRTGTERDRLARALPGTRWLSLEILDVVEGGPDDETGIVEFQATCTTAGELRVMRERSSFEKRDGEWLYVSGEFLEPISSAPGRNDPCPCGSGRKAKKCCGQRGRPGSM